MFADRAAMQLEIDIDVCLDRRRGRERVDEVGPCIHRLGELAHVFEVAQRLDAAGGRAGTDGDQRTRLPPHRMQTLGIVRRGDRAFHQRYVVRATYHATRRLREVGDVDRAGDRQQFVLAVEQRKLAAVAGGELPDGELRFAWWGHV